MTARPAEPPGRDRGLAEARRHLPDRSRADRGAAAARSRAPRTDRDRRLLLRTGARRARARREREGRGGVAGRGRPVHPRARHRPGGRRPRQRRDQRPAEVPLRPHLLPSRRAGDRSGQPPGLHVRGVRRNRRRRRAATGRGDFTEHEWWTKYSREIGGAEGQYDFPPHVVDVATTFEQRHVEDVDGHLLLRESPWDPIATRLPIRGPWQAQLVTHQPKARVITNAGPLDPEAFWPHADVIGGSRWPGLRGGPLPMRGRFLMGRTTDRYAVVSADCHAGRACSATSRSSPRTSTTTSTVGRGVREPVRRQHGRRRRPQLELRTPPGGDGGRRRPRRGDLPQHGAAVLPEGLPRRAAAGRQRRRPRPAVGRPPGPQPLARRLLQPGPRPPRRPRARSCCTTSTPRCARSSGRRRTGSPAASSCPARRPARACRRSTPPTTNRSGRRARTSACRSTTTAAAPCRTWARTRRPR